MAEVVAEEGEVVAEDGLHERAQAIAEQLCALAPLTLWATKTSLFRLRDAAVAPVPDGDILAACYMSADFQEGVNKGVKEIPAFFVNGEMVQGKATYDNISKSINEALKKVKKKASAKAKA